MRGRTNRVDLEIPFRARSLEVNNHFFVREIEFFQDDVSTLSPGAAVVGVEGYLGGGTVGCGCGAVSVAACHAWGWTMERAGRLGDSLCLFEMKTG